MIRSTATLIPPRERCCSPSSDVRQRASLASCWCTACSTDQGPAAIAPHLPAARPRLYWHLKVDGWSLLGYEVVDGRHADYTPGSPDLPLVEAALAEREMELTFGPSES